MIKVGDWVRTKPNYEKRLTDGYRPVARELIGKLEGNPPYHHGYDRRYPCMVVYHFDGGGPYMAFYSEDELETITEKEVMLWKLQN